MLTNAGKQKVSSANGRGKNEISAASLTKEEQKLATLTCMDCIICQEKVNRLLEEKGKIYDLYKKWGMFYAD